MDDLNTCPIDQIVMRRKSLKRALSAAEGLQDLRIAILGGSATQEFVNFLDLLLLHNGFRPALLESEYGRFYEDAVIDPAALIEFAPDIVYLHTSCLNVTPPALGATETELERQLDGEMTRYRQIWNSLEEKLRCQIIQNNFELPPYSLLGNSDAVAAGGQTRFLMEMNLRFSREAAGRPRLLLLDIHGLSAGMGLHRWFDWDRYFSYKILRSAEANVETARSLSSLVRALYGKSRKALILDLDNTLWGGVIGDDGLDGIQIGRETPVAEAYTAFQEYCLALRSRGVLLAVCSKNDDAVARSGFSHPSSVLKLEQISCFKANWEPKHENILAIAKELNLGVDSFVFVDDNPAERALVAAQLPAVAVPDMGDNVAEYPGILDRGRYFESAALSQEDLGRARHYEINAERSAAAASFADYGEYLASLNMTAEIETFQPVYLDRIAQLTNKTNQFNLTTRRITLAEMKQIAEDPMHIGLYGRLADRFGDNGLVSVVIGRRDGLCVHLDLWLMSCRVLKRDLELAMLDAMASRALSCGARTLIGYYRPTPKNGMVKDFYPALGFSRHETAPEAGNATVWRLDLAGYTTRNKHITVKEMDHGKID